MKSKWLPTMPLHVETWMVDPRIRDLTNVQRGKLIDALAKSWICRRRMTRVPKAIREVYDFYWPQYDAERVRCEKAYARRGKAWSEYSRQLADPRWMALRNQILERDEWRCTVCDSENRLAVHHKRYIKGAKAWEYDHADLITLCHWCHEDTHGRKLGR